MPSVIQLVRMEMTYFRTKSNISHFPGRPELSLQRGEIRRENWLSKNIFSSLYSLKNFQVFNQCSIITFHSFIFILFFLLSILYFLMQKVNLQTKLLKVNKTVSENLSHAVQRNRTNRTRTSRNENFISNQN